jgi:hypothetical protein
MDYDRFNDEYDPEPDYDKPTLADEVLGSPELPEDYDPEEVWGDLGTPPADDADPCGCFPHSDTREMTEAEIRAEMLLEDD